MYLEIITPEATIFKGDVDSVSVPGVNGDFEMLNNHAPIVSVLKDGFVKIVGDITLDDSNKAHFEKKGDSYLYAIDSGAIEMNANKVIVLAD
ncbi:F0F1 ATP synthase subunit epsilon [Flavobacteriaceae bacterium]|nr:F0F1 ATP synthase subunit epsilon [Flavobacteriaceae bacterium]|tara:strand:+ start:353 stop:628 length:276 start_codon:yes stop_codon:yes gene_type:complete